MQFRVRCDIYGLVDGICLGDQTILHLVAGAVINHVTIYTIVDMLNSAPMSYPESLALVDLAQHQITSVR